MGGSSMIEKQTDQELLIQSILDLTDNTASFSTNSASTWKAGDEYVIDWASKDIECPTTEQVQTRVTELKTEQDALEYARNRKAEYDALNQFELISDDANNGTTTHKDAVNAIKTKYPKP